VTGSRQIDPGRCNLSSTYAYAEGRRYLEMSYSTMRFGIVSSIVLLDVGGVSMSNRRSIVRHKRRCAMVGG
jgi:hypothetical protein